MTRSHTLILLITVTCLAVLLEPVTAAARIIHRERSLYSTILVDQRGSLVCLQFSVRSDQRNQSCKDLNRPRDLVFGYAKLMLTSLLLMPDPQRILVVGLGGGTLPMTLNELYPHAEIDVVEIDPAVLTVAETYFDFAENDQIDVIIQAIAAGDGPEQLIEAYPFLTLQDIEAALSFAARLAEWGLEVAS